MFLDSRQINSEASGQLIEALTLGVGLHQVGDLVLVQSAAVHGELAGWLRDQSD
jgi:hypothetical protein